MPKKINQTPSILGIPPFYLMLVVLVFMGLSYIMLLGLPTDNPGLIIFSLIFGFLAVTSTLLFSNALSKTEETFTTSAQGLLIGFVAWFSFLSLKNIFPVFSFFTVQSQSTLSTIQGAIPPFYEFFASVIWAPIIEEFFWAIALPIVIFAFLGNISKEFPIFKNAIMQFFIVLFICGLTFASFHTSATLIGFYIAATIFRTIQIVLMYGDQKYDIIKGYTITYTFLIGTHMSNNLHVYGVGKAYNILLSEPLGWITLVILSVIVAIAVRGFFIRK